MSRSLPRPRAPRRLLDAAFYTSLALAGATVLFLVAAPGPSADAAGRSQDLAPATGPELDENGLATALFEQTIHTAYETLQKYTAAAGAEVRFEVRNLETYPEGSFDRLRMSDVATMPDGRLIEVRRSSMSGPGASGALMREVEYEASWISKEPEWRGSAEMKAGIGIPLSEALVLLAESEERFQRLGAVTTYDVTATLEDESRSYSASFYWFRKPGVTDWSQFDLLVSDHVTQGVEAALLERVPVENRLATAPLATVPTKPGFDAEGAGGDGVNVPQEKLGCIAGLTYGNAFAVAGLGTNSHFVGSHNADASFVLTCTCDSACAETCRSGVSGITCEDGGITEICHKMGYATDASLAVGFSGTTACAAGFKCVQKGCLFCACGLSVTVSAFGSQVSFGGDTGAWEFKRSGTITCPGCNVENPDGGGGGVGGCGAGATVTSTAVLLTGPDVDMKMRARGEHIKQSTYYPLHGIPGMEYPLYRVEKRQGESFIMEEWALVTDGEVVRTSDPAFGDAVIAQDVAPGAGTRLVVQRPIHVMNSRHVPDPGLLVAGHGLPRSLHGAGEITVRIEYGKGGQTESVEVLAAKGDIDQAALERVLRRRVRPIFAGGGKTHRSVAYVVLQLTDDLQLVSSLSALPQCCCGTEEPFCI